MKITSKHVFLGVLVLGVVLCMVVYLGVFTPFNDKTDALEISNAALKTEVDEMKPHFDNIPVYRTQSAEMLEEVDKLTADYPGDAREEDVIMMAVDMQEAAIVNYESIGIDGTENLHTIAKEVVDKAGTESLTEEIKFNAKKATYTNTTDYSNLKTCIETVYKSPYRIGINSIVYKKESDENKVITGTMDITYYSVEGMGKKYTEPDMAEYLKGTEELFGKIKQDEAIMTGGVEPNAAGGADVQAAQ